MGEDFRVGSVAECGWSRQNPLCGIVFTGKVGEIHRIFTVAASHQIIVVLWLPAVFKFFKHTATRFREAGIAKVAAIHEHLAPCGFDSLLHRFGRGACYALIALAVVVGTHIEVDVVVAIPPFNFLSWLLGGFAKHHIRSGTNFVFIDLSQKPAS